MDMAHGRGHFYLNSHAWYHIDTPLNVLRATLWCLSNFITAVAYFFIPNEIRHWQTALSFSSSSLIGRLFMGFIAFCGLSHLSMLVIMQTAPWWVTLLIYLPMAIVSAATVVVLRRERTLLVAALASIGSALRVRAK